LAGVQYYIDYFHRRGVLLIQPFSLRHLFLMNRLRREGTLLSLEEALTQPYHPLWAALAAYFSLREAGALTYVLDLRQPGQRATGFIQMRERRGRPEGEVLYLAPALQAADNAFILWLRLLNNLCIWAGARGLQRVYAGLPDEGDEVDIFQQVGFSIYTREEVFRLEGPQPAGTINTDLHLRPRQGKDSWALRQLYSAVTPRLVQQAEGMIANQHEALPPGWEGGWGQEVFVWQNQRGDIVGSIQIRRGTLGHWLRLHLHPQAEGHAPEVIAQGLALLNSYPSRPVYCSVREYQGYLCPVLEAHGFEPFASQVLMVKHTTVRVKQPLRKLVPALEKRAEVTTPTVGQRID